MEAGFYWVTMSQPVCDGGGILDETWREPQIARFDGGRSWTVTGEGDYVPDQITVRPLSGPLQPPRAALPDGSELAIAVEFTPVE
jgi:hypothetical protein